MQNNRTTDAENRLLQKSYMSAQMRRDKVFIVAKRAVEDALILYPETPAPQIAEILFKHAPEELASPLHELLAKDFYSRLIRSERRKQTGNKQPELPGFEHLPVRIQISDTNRISLLDANHTQVRAYYRLLMQKHRDRKKNDPRIGEAKKLLERMEQRSKTDRGITVREAIF